MGYRVEGVGLRDKAGVSSWCSFSYLALSFSVYASANLPSLKTSHSIAPMTTTAIAVLMISPVNSRPRIGCGISLHLKHATKLLVIKGIVDESFRVTSSLNLESVYGSLGAHAQEKKRLGKVQSPPHHTSPHYSTSYIRTCTP
jgi:hypothetical protein